MNSLGRNLTEPKVMDVAFLSDVVYPYTKGGAEKRIYEISTRLAKWDHNVTLYCRHFWEGPKITELAGVTLHAIGPERDLYANGGERRSIIEALTFALNVPITLRKNSHKHDIVVASIFPYFPIISARFALINMDVPLVVTWHEVWGEYWNQYLGHFGPIGKTTEYLTARMCQHHVAVSEVTANRLSKIGPPIEQISRIPNGVDLKRIRNLKKSSKRFDVLFVGRLIPEKNVGNLIEAFNQIAKFNDITLGIVGEGPLRESLEQKANHCEASDSITFLGLVEDYDDVISLMKSASIFASPSIREGFGITYLEAMASGCIVIGANHKNSAASEIINDAGIIAEPSVQGIRVALEKALDGYRPPKNPRETAQRFDWDLISKKAETVYCSIVNQ